MDTLAKRYGDMNYILDSDDLVMGYEIIKMAYTKKAEEQLWEQYLCDRQSMTQENFMTFEKYKIEAFGNKTITNKKEILKDAELIKMADQRCQKGDNKR